MASTDNSSYKPEPTRLVLLDEVAQQEAGTKIRFLGCIHEYKVTRGTITLRDRFPVTDETKHTIMVKVDNERLSLKIELLQVGAWLNIIGYVRKPVKIKAPIQRVSGQRAARSTTKAPLVDATLVWSAGAIQHDRYQAAVKSYQATT